MFNESTIQHMKHTTKLPGRGRVVAPTAELVSAVTYDLDHLGEQATAAKWLCGRGTILKVAAGFPCREGTILALLSRLQTG